MLRHTTRIYSLRSCYRLSRQSFLKNGYMKNLFTSSRKRPRGYPNVSQYGLLRPNILEQHEYTGHRFYRSTYILFELNSPNDEPQDLVVNVDGDLSYRKKRIYNVLNASNESEAAVIRALVGNGFITICKFGAYGMTGSSAMFGEAIHSLCDMGNQAMLIKGIKQMQKAPDAYHNYGYGRAAFFWGLVSALGMFWLGCGFTVYHGTMMLMHPPEQLEITWHVWAVLGLSFAIDGYVLSTIVKSMSKRKPKKQTWRNFLRNIKDPFTMGVLFEDTAACVGVLIASGGLVLTQVTGNVAWDGIASIAIGGILGVSAYTLAKINQKYLIGQAIDKDMESDIRNILLARDCIEHVYAVRSQWISPSHFSFKAEVDFDGTVLAAKLYQRYERHFLDSKDLRGDLLLLLSWYAEDVTRVVESEVRYVEKIIRRKYPEAAYIELEPDSARTFEHAVEGMQEEHKRRAERDAIREAMKKVTMIMNQKHLMDIEKT